MTMGPMHDHDPLVFECGPDCPAHIEVALGDVDRPLRGEGDYGTCGASNQEHPEVFCSLQRGHGRVTPGDGSAWDHANPERGAWWRTPLPSAAEGIALKASRVPDLPCPKCGHEEVRMNLCQQARLASWPEYLCRHGDPDHFHRTCQRCRYEWRTDDVLSA